MLKRDFYLVCSCARSHYGGRPVGLKLPRIVSAKSSSTPATKKDEVAIRVSIELPEQLFAAPAFKASIKVDESSVTAATVDAEVINNIEQVVAEATGLRLEIESVPSLEDEI
ncbi:hypothetical protein [Roseiconus lacunae]|uniref:hypothetical protein n=1 Tax=Roseiconus lacunae TaxID=2605694 RepID=UPI001E375918|nr:hypothetical protein [Roseiconus lacunae]MCD0459154.1 hypothetical protein [Roseiconus lacunae]